MDIMQAILDIEEKARGISDSAAAAEENYEADIQKEIKHREQESREQVAKQLEQLRLRMDAERQEDMEQLETFYEHKLEALSKQCQEKKQAWIDSITEAVIRF